MILKKRNIIKPILPDKIHQKLKILLRFAWKSDNKIRSDKTLWELLLDKIQKLKRHLMIVKSSHCFQKLCWSML